MTESPTPPAATTPAPAAPPPAGDPPQGFVPVTELEREQTRARTFQAEKDRLEAELNRLKAAPPAPAAPASGSEDKGFDPDAFAQGLLDRVYQANALATAAVSLRSEFPNADPSLFSPTRLSQYGSVEALRIAAESDHNRVTGINAAALEAERAKIRAEFVAAYGQEPPTGPSGGGGQPVAGDPTPEALAAMTFDEFARFDAEHPGVADRVLRNVTPAGAMQHQIV
jgi:hypothetical protein